MGVIVSAGLLIIQNNKMLLAHPSKAPWYGTYTIPKGKVEEGESYIDTAIRETKEEIGIVIEKGIIEDIYNTIYYINDKNQVYKKVHYFVVYPDKEININESNLAMTEVNWAGFLDRYEVMERIFWRFGEMIKYLDY